MRQPTPHLSTPNHDNHRRRGRFVDLHARGTAELLEPRLCLTALFAPAPGPGTALGFLPNAAAVGDFNGDGIPDVAAISNTATGSTLHVLLGNGHGGFTPAPGTPIIIAYGDAIAVGDFTGNGRMDLAIADNANGLYASGTVSIYLGNGDGTFAVASGITVGNFPVDVVAGSFTSNGRSDLVVADFNSGEVSVLLSNKDGTFAPAPGSPLSVPGGRSVSRWATSLATASSTLPLALYSSSTPPWRFFPEMETARSACPAA